MAATTALLTVERYRQIPDPPGGRYELHHGELVFVPPPTPEHAQIQDAILAILMRQLEPTWHVSKELAFRPLPEHEVWTADLGVVRKVTWKALRREWLGGAPEVVIEVLSPSNTAQEMIDREVTCFEAGCRQFWVVDPRSRTIRVNTPGGHAITYGATATVALSPWSETPLAVAEVFAG